MEGAVAKAIPSTVYRVEESGMLGDIQWGFRVVRRTEDKLFIVERMIEMVKVRKECLFVAFIDMKSL